LSSERRPIHPHSRARGMSSAAAAARSIARMRLTAFTRSTSALGASTSERQSSDVSAQKCSARTFASSAREPEAAVRLYRGPHIKVFRLLVRSKLMQLGAAGGLATPLFLSAAGDDASGTLATAAVACGVGSAACAAAMQYYASRYVGELALVENGRKLRVSTMDFWGKRVDETFDVATRVVPPLKGLSKREIEDMAQRIFIPLDIVGSRQFVVSLRHGDFSDREKLFDVLSAGEYARRFGLSRTDANDPASSE